ncbi:MAG: ClbS/DfsB family four-helix bundle protein [Ktedonobacterales bacterium]|nr:ClbS/DfsB family four-helix bundle protein [Ktedonobacterales bacterium]
MPTPTNKTALLEQIAQSRARLEDLLARVPPAEVLAPVLAGGWSVKDVLAHIVYWEQRALLILANARAGQSTPLSWEPGEDVATAIDRVNEAARVASHAQSFTEVQERFAASHQEVCAVLTALPEDYLFGSDDFARVTGGDVIELIASNTYDHYQEHIAMLAAWLGA